MKIISLVTSLAKLGSWLARLFSDEKLRQAGRNEVAAESARQGEAAREHAHDKIQTADDATAAARDRLRMRSSADDPD